MPTATDEPKHLSIQETSDLRSSSIPHHRFTSRRAKYGRLPTPTYGFNVVPNWPYPPWPKHVIRSVHIALGPPETHVTPKDQFIMAQETVESLIGKRTGKHRSWSERDPWLYFGAGRRWEKMARSGRDVGEEDRWDVLYAEEEALWSVAEMMEEEVPTDDEAGDVSTPPEAEDQDWDAVIAEHEQEDRWTGEEDGWERNADTVTVGTLGDIARWTTKKGRRRSVMEWEILRLHDWVSEDVEIDDWDLVSICSALR